MNQTELQASLEAELAVITNELNTIAVQDKLTGDWVAVPETSEINSADPNTNADAAESWGENRAILEQLEIRYRNIKRALTKIEEGTYGICEISGNQIEDERLEANPAARTNLANIEREKELPL